MTARVMTNARWGLALLLAINLFNYIDRYVLSAALVFIGKEPGFFAPDSWAVGFMHWFQRAFGFAPKDAMLGLLSTAFMVSYMVLAPLFGRLAERYSRWMLVGIGVVLWSLASGASGLATTFGVLLLTRCFVGVGEAAYGPVAPTIISDYFPVANRGRVLAWFYMAIPVGSALGYVLGGTVGHSSLGWRWAFYLVVVPGILLGLVSFFMREPVRGASDSLQGSPPKAVSLRQYGVLFRTPSYVLCSAGMTAMTFAMGGIGTWMPAFLERMGPVPGLTKNPTALFGVLSALSGLTGTMLGGILGDRLRSRFPGSYFLVSGVTMLAGLPLFVAFFFVPFPWAWLLLFLTCVCLFFNTGPTNTILANVTHPAMRASAFALNIFVIHAFGDVLSPFVIGLLADRFGMRKAFLCVAVMFVASGILWLAGTRFLQRDTELAPLRLRANPKEGQADGSPA
jgi:MFS family permease